VLEVEDQNAEEHDHAADQRVNDELHRRILPALAAQMAMMKYIGTSTVSQKRKTSREIERHEDAQHGGLQQQEEGVVFLEPILNALQLERMEIRPSSVVSMTAAAKPVDAQMIGGADGGDPGRLFDELKVLGAVRTGRPAGEKPRSRGMRRCWPTTSPRAHSTTEWRAAPGVRRAA